MITINQPTLNKALSYWTRQLPTTNATIKFARDLETGLLEAAKAENEAVKLCSNDSELPTNDPTYVLLTACSKNDIGITQFRSALMWVYADSVELKEFGDRTFTSL